MEEVVIDCSEYEDGMVETNNDSVFECTDIEFPLSLRCLSSVLKLEYEGHIIPEEVGYTDICSLVTALRAYPINDLLMSNVGLADVGALPLAVLGDKEYKLTCGDCKLVGAIWEKHDGYPIVFFGYKGRYAAMNYDCDRRTYMLQSASYFLSEGAEQVQDILYVKEPSPCVIFIGNVPYKVSMVSSTYPSDVKYISRVNEGIVMDIEGVHYRLKRNNTIDVKCSKGLAVTKEETLVAYVPSQMEGIYEITFNGDVLRKRDDKHTPDNDSKIQLLARSLTLNEYREMVKHVPPTQFTVPQEVPHRKFKYKYYPQSLKYTGRYSSIGHMKYDLVLSSYIIGSLFDYDSFIQDIRYSGEGGDWGYIRGFLNENGIVQYYSSYISIRPRDKLDIKYNSGDIISYSSGGLKAETAIAVPMQWKYWRGGQAVDPKVKYKVMFPKLWCVESIEVWGCRLNEHSTKWMSVPYTDVLKRQEKMEVVQQLINDMLGNGVEARLSSIAKAGLIGEVRGRNLRNIINQPQRGICQMLIKSSVPDYTLSDPYQSVVDSMWNGCQVMQAWPELIEDVKKVTNTSSIVKKISVATDNLSICLDTIIESYYIAIKSKKNITAEEVTLLRMLLNACARVLGYKEVIDDK